MSPPGLKPHILKPQTPKPCPLQGKTALAATLCSQQPAKVHAHHFLSSSDTRRRDPVRVAKSLGYQLSLSVPGVQDHYLNLSAEGVRGLQQPDRAFQLLLAAPLERLSAEVPSGGVSILVMKMC